MTASRSSWVLCAISKNSASLKQSVSQRENKSLICAGSDKSGSMQYLVYGYKYPQSEEARELIKRDFLKVFEYIAEK